MRDARRRPPGERRGRPPWLTVGALVVGLTLSAARPVPAAEVPACGEPESAAPAWTRRAGEGSFVGVSRREGAEADARAGALADARRQIVEFLGVRVESEFTERIAERRGASTHETESDLQQLTRTLARAVLQVREDAFHVTRCRDDADAVRWKAYALVRFDSARHRAFVAAWVAETARITRALVARARDDAGSAPGAALAAYVRAGRVVREVEEAGGLPPDAKATLRALREDVLASAGRLLASLRIDTRGDGQVGAEGSGLAAPLSLTVTTADGVPVAGLPVAFRFRQGAGQLDQNGRTDADGAASAVVSALRRSPQGWTVEASLLDRETARRLELTPPNRTFRIRSGRGRLLYAVVFAGWRPDPAPPATLLTAVTDALAERGFEVQDVAALAAAGSSSGARDERLRALARDTGATHWLRFDVTLDPPRPGPLGPDSRMVSLSLRITAAETASGRAVLSLGLPNDEFTDLRGFAVGAGAERAAARDALGPRPAKLHPSLVGTVADRIERALGTR